MTRIEMLHEYVCHAGWWPLGNQNESAILRWPVASQAKDEAVRAAEEEAIEAATKNGAIKAKR